MADGAGLSPTSDSPLPQPASNSDCDSGRELQGDSSTGEKAGITMMSCPLHHVSHFHNGVMKTKKGKLRGGWELGAIKKQLFPSVGFLRTHKPIHTQSWIHFVSDQIPHGGPVPRSFFLPVLQGLMPQKSVFLPRRAFTQWDNNGVSQQWPSSEGFWLRSYNFQKNWLQ